MRLHRSLLVVSVCILLCGIAAQAQSRKPGLYEVTATMNWQHSPFPGGMGPGAGPHTTQICVTQEQIDKYGDAPPQTHGNCQLNDVQKSLTGMKATLVCSKPMEGKGTVESTYADGMHAHTTIHFSGVMQMGTNSQPFEWTLESNSAYKGPDCGSVKPLQTK